MDWKGFAMKDERLHIPYPVLVEGRYDKMRLEHLLDAHILTTDGFGVFNQAEKRMLLRRLAEQTPLLVLTDSDGAGKLIRSYISSVVPPERLFHLYIPHIEGKEKRKKKPSREGFLGVEGMENDLLRDLFAPYADADGQPHAPKGAEITKTDFFLDGLSGSDGSAARRDEFAAKLGLPAKMTPNALLAAVRLLCTYEEYCALVERNRESEER